MMFHSMYLSGVYPEYFVSRGAVHYFLHEYELAIQDFNRAIELNPEYERAYNNRGLAYQALGKTAEAQADFEKYNELTGQKP
jgi:tetratricopeptide (TPR) repeat protein